MMALLNFKKREAPEFKPRNAAVEALLEDYSIEVMPRTAEKVEDFRALCCPAGTRVYIAHIDGTPIEDMVATAKRLPTKASSRDAAFPGALIPDPRRLPTGSAATRGGGRETGLLLGGGIADAARRIPLLHAASGNRLLRPTRASPICTWRAIPRATATSTPMAATKVMAALQWKQDFADRTDASFAIATQFAFEAKPSSPGPTACRGGHRPCRCIWAYRGPAKLQTLIKFAIACGVGPSLGCCRSARWMSPSC
jgi:methylenetetrahydrofolate reductase (NADPH)